MSLALFARSVHEDPLLAAEGMDTSDARAALDLIEEGARGLQVEFVRRSLGHRLFFMQHPLATHALPVPFLRALCAAEDARVSFMQQTNTETAARLVAAWKHAHAALRTCTARYRHLHTVAIRVYMGDSQLVYEDDFQNTSTVPDILTTLDLFEKNVIRLGAEIEERRKLLAGEVTSIPPRTSATPVGAPCQEREWHAQYEQLIEYAERDFTSQWAIEEKHMVRHCVAVFDEVPTTHAFILYILRDKQSGRRRAKVSLVDEYLFFSLGDDKDFGPIGETIYKPLIDRGVPYWYQDPALFYTTREQQYWADVAAMVDQKRRPELSSHIAVQKSSLFHLILHAYADMVFSWTRIFRARARRGDMSYSLLYGLLSRSNPSLLFMPFNGSVWRISEMLNFIGSGRSEKGMYRRSDEVLDTLSPEALDLVMRGPAIRRSAWREEEERG